ncbi:MAG: DEAD/DEAH box helicase, partial [Cyclobacteriaceae bacterium]
AKGFDIYTESYKPEPLINLAELASNKAEMTLFGENGKKSDEEEGKILIELQFEYGDFKFKADNIGKVSVTVEKKDDNYIFHRIKRDRKQEKSFLNVLNGTGLNLKNSKAVLSKSQAFGWLDLHRDVLEDHGFNIRQRSMNGTRYFIGEYKIDVQVKENIDWFDIHAVIRFGEYEIPFQKIRKLILRKKLEFELPNGEIAVIPDSWINQYGDLFAFAEEDDGQAKLAKHHLALVQELEEGDMANVQMSRKLEGLREFEKIEEAPVPETFKGSLRPYQKAGYHWLRFLNEFRFGGCLADDMGLGKTVQTLAFLLSMKEIGQEGPSLLIMPTSLVYNWEKEAHKFTPSLKVFTYTGTNRTKDPTKFSKYDIILTSYGIVRLDIDLLDQFYFNHIILDESQAIKNPSSNIAKAVGRLKSRSRLILTGTPLENSTMDLWSQMNFINPGLLGTQSYFKNEFLHPIEKKGDEDKLRKLHSVIKPFILRRHKSQVARELPEKVENIQLCQLSPDQKKEYEEVKSYYRNRILENIESAGLNKSQLLLLQGLTKLRQIANHPRMVNPDYEGDSGKMEDVIFMLDNAIRDDHKILVFSQFVKHLSILADHLKEEKIDFAYLDGSTKDRAAQVERFQEDKTLKVFLISLKAGGLGLNLTQADYVFILDPWWNPAIEAQAVDRAHRIGQENKVFTYKFITKDTVEEKILALQGKKKKLAAELITTEKSFVKSLNKDDIQSLLT